MVGIWRRCLALLELELVWFSGRQVVPEALNLITHRTAFRGALPSLQLGADHSNSDADRQKWINSKSTLGSSRPQAIQM
jgi:hypothetical protein